MRTLLCPSRAARPHVCPLFLAFAFAIFLAFMQGCAGGPTPREQSQAVEVSARSVEALARALTLAAYEDARQSCPDRLPDCMSDVEARWAPADASILAARLALISWLAANQEDAWMAASAFAMALDDATSVLRRLGVTL